MPTSAPFIDTDATVRFRPSPGAACAHTDQVQPVQPSAQGCEECLEAGDAWVHLRLCLVCGHVGCCDSSEGKHAAKHFHASGHALIRSAEPGETWGWCYVDEVEL